MIKQILGYGFLLAATIMPVWPQNAPSQVPCGRRCAQTKCDTVKKVVCTEGKCEDITSSVYFRLGKHEEESSSITFFLLGEFEGKPSYSRCDQNGCETYPAIVKTSGVYENWHTVEPAGVMFKRAIGGKQDFVDVATGGLQVYVSTGVCKSVVTQ